MKNIFKILILGITLSFTACSESDALINQVLDTVDTESGVVLRTIGDLPDLVTVTNEANNFINTTIEVQQGDGSFMPDFKEVNMYIELFNDQDLLDPLLDNSGNMIGELFLQKFEPDVFSISANGLPRTDVNIIMQDVADLYTSVDASPGVPSFIALRFEIVMNDGRIISTNDVGATISGGIYFNSPFLFKVIFLPI
jgi:hypothetical protein